MPILRSLLNAGVNPADAQVLDAHFSNEPESEFLDGLEQIARALALNEIPTAFPPGSEPWKSIHGVILSNGQPLDDAFNQSVAAYPAQVQMAITGAVTQRMLDIQHFMQQQAQSPGKRHRTAEYVKLLVNLGYRFRFNLCTWTVEVNGEKLIGPVRSQIRAQMRDKGVAHINAMEDAYTTEAWKNKFHPVKDYLTNLKFEGGDPIGDLASYFQYEYGMFPVWLKRWLIGACAKAMAAEENRMLVLDGPQGIGKSHFVKWLSSPLPEYFVEGGIDTSSEDVYRRLGQRWIWEVSELGATTRKSDWEALKAFITMRNITTRIKYDRDDTDMPALANLIGTINNEEGFMPVSDRRFFVERITAIDWGYSKIDVDQVWAQAFELYLTGEAWEPTGDERERAREISDEYRMLDIVEETIKRFFVIDPSDNSLWMATTEIMEVLKDTNKGNLKSGSEIDTRKLSRALTKLGLDKPKLNQAGGNRARGYYGIRLSP